jgi:low temperature requirement protein LtrA
LTRREEPTGTGTTTIELFFDLVFVFTITQLTHGVVVEPTTTGVARSMLILGNLWWMYGGYVWLTNAVPPTGDRERLLLLVGMGGFLVVALAIPSGFGDGGVALGAGYLVVNLVHGWLLLGSVEGSLLQALGRLGPANLGTAGLIFAAGYAPGPVTWALWTAAFVLHWATPYLTDPTVVSLRSRHFVERHGLIVLIALGESVFAVGASVGDDTVSFDQLLAAVCGLVTVAALWWLYFDRDDGTAAGALDATAGPRRAWLAIHAYGYAFLPLLGGVIVFAAGLELGIARPGSPASTASATLVAAGVSAYAVGLLAIRARLRLGPLSVRLALVPLALATIPLGVQVSSLAQLAGLGALLVGAGVVERRLGASPAATAS